MYNVRDKRNWKFCLFLYFLELAYRYRIASKRKKVTSALKMLNQFAANDFMIQVFFFFFFWIFFFFFSEKIRFDISFESSACMADDSQEMSTYLLCKISQIPECRLLQL